MSPSTNRYRRIIATLVIGLSAILAVAAVSGCAQQSGSAAYPTKPVELVVPFAPGGATDQTARALTPYLSKKWGQPVNVVNKAGAGGTTGTVSVIQAAPDGYSMIMLANSNGILNDAIQTDLPYHWDSVLHVGRVNVTPVLFVVKGDSKYNSFKELVDAMKADPSKFKYGSSGVGGPSTFATAQLAEAAGIDAAKLDRVPFDGGAPASAAAAGGHVDFVAQLMPEVLEMVRGGKLKALAITTSERSKLLPNVPTTKELGFPTVTEMGLNGVGAPTKLPADIAKKWEDSMGEVSKDPQYQADLEKIGGIAAYQSAKDFRAWMESEHKSHRALAEKLGLRK
ncbi:MAG: Bug family tripartite tricarboxylate transporter substrate binding protein [Chloroflexota bacterium]